MKTATFTLGSSKYDITQLGAIEGRRVLARVFQLLGPAVRELVNAEHLTQEAGLAAGAALLEKLEPDVMDEICNAFVGTTRVHTAPNKAPKLEDVFNEHFAGKYIEMLQWLWSCLTHNFADFLSDSPSTLLQSVVVGSRLKSQPDSTGTSGDS